MDFEKAFDSIYRGILWEIMGDYSIPSKLITMVKAMYEQSKWVGNFNINGKKTGLKITLRKTVVMKWNVNPGIKIQLEGSDIEKVEKFVYLGVTVTTTGGAGEVSGWEKHKQSSGGTVNSA